MFIIITVLLTHGKGVKYCCVWSQFSLDVFQTCYSKSCLVLLSINLPSLSRFMGHNSISIDSLTKQSTHFSTLSILKNAAEFHAVQYKWYVLLQPNSLAGPGKGASSAPCIWFLNYCSSDIHLPTSTWYTPHIRGFQDYFSLVVFYIGRWWVFMSHLASSLLTLFEAACW